MSATPIGESTPVTIGILVLVVALAFWAGLQSQKLAHAEQGQSRVEVAILEIQRTTYELKEASLKNAARIQALEDRDRADQDRASQRPYR